MAGIRLHHPTLASCMIVVELELPYPGGAIDCPICGKDHERKAMHLRLDSAGDVIVSPEALEALRGLPGSTETIVGPGLEVTNEVLKPPALYLGAVEQPKIEVVEIPLGGNGRRSYKPEKTKYESRDQLHKGLRGLFKRRPKTDG